MAGTKEINSHVDIKGKIIVDTVPNATGTVVTYDLSTKALSTRTHAEIISDLSLMTTNTEQIINSNKWFMTEGGSDIVNHSLRVISYDNSYPGLVFYREGANSGTLQYDGTTYYFTNNGIQDFGFVKSKGYIKHDSNDTYLLTGGGGHETKNNYLKLEDNKSIDISVSNLNTLFNTGFYRGVGLINAPENNAGWWYVIVERHDIDWAKQIATSYGSLNTPNVTFQRVCVAGTWTIWEEVITSRTGGSNHYWKIWSSGAVKGINAQTPFYLVADNGVTAQHMYTGGLLASNIYLDCQYIPTNGIYSKGIIKGGLGLQTYPILNNQRNRIWSFSEFDECGISYMQGSSHSLGEGFNFHFGDSNDYGVFLNRNSRIFSKLDGTSEQWKSAYDFSLVGATQTHVNENFLNTKYLVSPITPNDAITKGVMANYTTGFVSGSTNGSLFTLNYSDIWSTQMYGDWRTNEWYVRTQNHGTWSVPQKLFHTGNFNPDNYATTSQIPTNNTQLINGAGYITSVALANYATQSWVNTTLNSKVNSWENAVAIGFQSSSSSGYPYFVHADNSIIPVATQSWVNNNFIPKTHPIYSVTQADINGWNATISLAHSHSNINQLNTINQGLATFSNVAFNSINTTSYVKSGGNFKSSLEEQDMLFIPDGSLSSIRDEIVNDVNAGTIRLDPHEYNIDSTGYIDIDDKNRLIHIVGEQRKMVVNLKQLYIKQEYVIYNLDLGGNFMELRIQDNPVLSIQPNHFVRLYVTESLGVIAETEQPCNLIW